jgi:hypothetical protein
MSWLRTSTVDDLPADPVGEAMAEAVLEVFNGSNVSMVYAPADGEPAAAPVDDTAMSATGSGPPGWTITLTVDLDPRLAHVVTPDRTPLLAMLLTLPGAGLRAAERLRPAAPTDEPLSPALARALRDLIIAELLGHLHLVDGGDVATTGLIEGTIDFLIELSGTRVEAQDLTHGVVISEVLRDQPRLRFDYPADLRSAKRGPLLFDGQRSVLIVDREGHARTELQRQRLARLTPESEPTPFLVELADSGSLVGAVTRLLGGVGFFLRTDRTIWVFVDGRPLLVRRAGHWTAFPLELATSIGNIIGGGAAAELVVQTALIISAQGHGAILAIVSDPGDLDGIVPLKDRFDLRNEFDPQGMRVETRLHHLIDARDLGPQTLSRLAALDGATVLDRDANLLAYGAIVTSSDSEFEGARTAAAKSLSETAEVVLKVSVDGDITVFQGGKVLATLLGQSPDDEVF